MKAKAKKVWRIKDRHYYQLHWETGNRVFEGVVFCFEDELHDLKGGDSFSPYCDGQEFVSLKDLGTAYRNNQGKLI